MKKFMQKTQTQTNRNANTQRGEVRINHWQNTRSIIVEDEQVMIEVTLARCNHCNTCLKRVDDFRKTLAAKPEVEHSWSYNWNGQWLTLPKAKWQDGLEYVKEVLELDRIEFV